MRHVNAQAYRPAAGANVCVRDASEVAGNECKQVGGDAMGAMKYAVTVAIHDVALKQVAVGKHDGELLSVSYEGRCET